MRRSFVVSIGSITRRDYRGVCHPGTGHAPGGGPGARRQRAEVDRVLGNRQMVPVRSGAEPDAALAAVRRQQLHGERQLRDTRRARADGRATRSSSPAAPGPPRSSSARSRSSAARYAWNMARAGRRRAGHRARAAAAAGRRRRADDGDLDDAARLPQGGRTANNATSQAGQRRLGRLVHVAGKNKYVGRINAQNQVERVQTWIDNPVLGDTPVEITYSDYRDFSGVHVPGHGSCGRRAAIRCSTSPSRR